MPGQGRLVIDARTTNPTLTRQFVEAIDRESLRTPRPRGFARGVRNAVRRRHRPHCDPDLRVRAAPRRARDLGLGEADLPSGAGHDAAFMSRICRIGDGLVPCRAGKSHAPEEWADREAIAAGAAVIYQAIKTLDRSLRASAGATRSG